jgi:hypothetical protein
LLADFFNDATPRDWMIEGAIREDDYSAHAEAEIFLNCPPPENPFSPIDRVFNHFLDVQREGRGLTIGKTLGLPASEWALGRQGQATPTNNFSLPDAREYQFHSLTASSRSERELKTALFFRALGHVIHLLHDVGQPQHTRNDPHSGCVPVIAGHSSWFERYIETRALGQQFRSRGQDSRPLLLDGYPARKLGTYEKYWSSPQQEGLGDLSSRHFFSVGTNLGEPSRCGGLFAPPCRLDAYRPEDRPFASRTVRGQPISGTVKVFLHQVPDPATLTFLDVAVTSRSVWDEHLEKASRDAVFTLNTLNYDSAADVLIPRAVGYSAGLLDRFFRANVGAGVDNDQRVTFHNGSHDEIAEGFFFVLHEHPDGVREPLASFAMSIGPQDKSGAVTVRKLPPNPPFGTRCWVVFRGTLGEEPNVVAGREMDCPVEPPPPVEGTEWAVYTCLLIPFIPDRPASPDQYVYYVYATTAWMVDEDGNPARSMTPNWRTQCWLSGRGIVPEGQVPGPDVRFDFIPADFVPSG